LELCFGGDTPTKSPMAMAYAKLQLAF